MQENNTEDLDAMTGIGAGGGGALVLDMLSLNGDAEIVEEGGQYHTKGGYYRLLKITAAKKDDKPSEVNLGEKVKVVFLKVRRVLQSRSSDGKLALWTSEHNTADDMVELKSKESQKVLVGSARVLRTRFPALRTVQFVYGLLFRESVEPQLVKMRFKGSALGSDAKDKANPTFYDYIYAERKNPDGSKRHLRHVLTELSTVKEQGKKAYFTVVFRDAGDLPADYKMLADDMLREVHGKLSAQDARVGARITALRAQGAETAPVEASDKSAPLDTIEYPENENTEDIPF